MLGWLKRRMRKEHLKLAKQNAMAWKYIYEFRESSIEAGQLAPDLFESAEETNYKTALGHLEDMARHEAMPQMILNDALAMNREARRYYEQILQGRVTFAQTFGSANERLLPFDKYFVPNEGWDIFFAHNAPTDAGHKK